MRKGHTYLHTISSALSVNSAVNRAFAKILSNYSFSFNIVSPNSEGMMPVAPIVLGWRSISSTA